MVKIAIEQKFNNLRLISNYSNLCMYYVHNSNNVNYNEFVVPLRYSVNLLLITKAKETCPKVLNVDKFLKIPVKRFL